EGVHPFGFSVTMEGATISSPQNTTSTFPPSQRDNPRKQITSESTIEQKNSLKHDSGEFIRETVSSLETVVTSITEKEHSFKQSAIGEFIRRHDPPSHIIGLIASQGVRPCSNAGRHFEASERSSN